MLPEIISENKLKGLDKIDMSLFLVPDTEKRRKALSIYRFAVNEIYDDTKRLIEATGDTETEKLFRILGDIANLTLRHSSQDTIRAMDPAETCLRFLRICKPKQYDKINNFQKSRKGRNLTNMLYDLGPDPEWITARRIVKSP